MDRLTQGTYWFREPASARRWRVNRARGGKRRVPNGRHCTNGCRLCARFAAKRRWFLDRIWRRGEDPGPTRRELEAICHEGAR